MDGRTFVTHFIRSSQKSRPNYRTVLKRNNTESYKTITVTSNKQQLTYERRGQADGRQGRYADEVVQG